MSLIPKSVVPMSCWAGGNDKYFYSQALAILREKDNKKPESPENQLQSHPERVLGIQQKALWLARAP